jgi:hypothetical protein
MPRQSILRLSDEDFHFSRPLPRPRTESPGQRYRDTGLKQIEEELFADEFEMEEILKNKNLLERLRTGSEQARRMKGRFVD